MMMPLSFAVICQILSIISSFLSETSVPMRVEYIENMCTYVRQQKGINVVSAGLGLFGSPSCGIAPKKDMQKC